MDCLPIGLRFMSAEDMLKIPSAEDYVIDRRYELMEDRSFLNEVVTRHLKQGNNYDLYEDLLVDWLLLSEEEFEEKFNLLVEGLYSRACDEAEEQALNELEEKRRDWEPEEG